MITQQLASYISTASSRSLPEEVGQKGTLHLLDTIAAIVSGTTLPPGANALEVLEIMGEGSECSVLGTGLRATAIGAALANGMFAHADETDDSHAPSLTHPGCAVVPAALAAAERCGACGSELLRAVVLGYDIGTRISLALGGSRFSDRYHLSSHAYAGTFGATAAASSLLGLSSEQVACALSYAVQLASGNRCWIRDPDHVYKAFIFGGMPAQQGVQAALMAAKGLTASPEPLEGTPGLFPAFAEEADPRKAVEELGTRYEVMRTSTKKWCVGSPIQAALDAMDLLVCEHRFSADDVEEVRVTLPAQRAQVVNSAMPNINLRHLLAVFLTDGTMTFASAHDHDRMSDPTVVELAARIRVEPRPGAARGEQAAVHLRLRDGRHFDVAPTVVRGQPGNPMTVEEVATKARDLMTPVLGDTTKPLIAALLALEGVGNVRDLARHWSPAARAAA